MIDGLIKHVLDPLWEGAATPLIRAGVTPNQVTLAGLGLICAASLAYLWHQSPAIFGITLALSFAFDALDGAVARRRGLSSKSGGYLDAMVDRYQELIVLAAIAVVHDLWALALAVFSGAILTSYAKARTALEAKVSNDGWPDLMERLERIIALCVLLVAASVLGAFGVSQTGVLAVGLGVLALLTHLTAAQRMRRAFGLLGEVDRGTASTPAKRVGDVDQVGHQKEGDDG